jgi:hypothetical protein
MRLRNEVIGTSGHIVRHGWQSRKAADMNLELLMLCVDLCYAVDLSLDIDHT